MKRKLSWFDKTVLLLLAVPFIIHGSTKPTPPTPPVFNVPVEVSIGYNSLVIAPAVPESLRDTLAGHRCDVQLQTDNGGWMTIKTVPAYDLTPITADGIYVDGGQGRVRRIRLSWPDVEYNSEEEPLQ